MQITTASAQETRKFAKEFLKKHLESNVLALYGDLGSGKTTFVQGLAQALGVDNPVTSPTFIIMQAYQLGHERFQQLVHIDLYRVNGWEDVEMLGLPEIWSDNKNLTVIEWPNRIEKHLPKQTQKLNFEYLGDDRRQITTRSGKKDVSR